MGSKELYPCRENDTHPLNLKSTRPGSGPINRKLILKKFLFFLIFVVIAIAIDGTLAKDIFDYGIDTLSGWLGLALIVGILLTLFWAETTKTHHDKNNRK